jgi:energy-coupling factor transporter ATP-binding protein EcfA2
VALIAGPTASGKSALAVALAKSLRESGTDALVVNADASQVYADLQILSARPTDEEMEGVPHRLFGHIDAAEAHNAARLPRPRRFGYPGGAVLPIYDALFQQDKVQHVLVRHEQGAACGRGLCPLVRQGRRVCS